jgi:hypothetical protein
MMVPLSVWAETCTEIKRIMTSRKFLMVFVFTKIVDVGEVGRVRL